MSQVRQPRLSSGEAFALSTTLVVLLGTPLALAWFSGSLGIPHNDAWSHARIAESFAESGTINLVGWNRSSLVGQVIVLGPLGASVAAQHLFAWLTGLLGLLCTYLWLRPRVGSAMAVLGVASVGAMPEFGLLATSYMADAPSFGAFMLCLALLDRALARSDPRWLGAALLAGVWAVTIREQALVAVAVAITAPALAWRGRRRWVAVALGVAAVGSLVWFELWRRSLAGDDQLSLVLKPWSAVAVLPRLALNAAFALSAVILGVIRLRGWSRASSAAAVGVTLAALAGAHRFDGFVGNYLVRTVAYPEASIGAPRVLSGPMWWALVAAACVLMGLAAGSVVAWAEARQSSEQRLWLRGRPETWIAPLALALWATGTLLQAFVGQAVFGRYLLPALPLLVGVVGHQKHLRLRLGAAVLVAMFVLTSLLTSRTLAYDAARWRAADALVARGIAAQDINAGLEWAGVHADPSAMPGQARSATITWWTPMFPSSRECFVVSGSPLSNDGWVEVGQSTYHSYVLSGESRVWTYRTGACG